MENTIVTPAGFAPPVRSLRSLWPLLGTEARAKQFADLSQVEAAELFVELPTRQQAELLLQMPVAQRRLWLRLLEPDDAADLLQQIDLPERGALLDLLDASSRAEVVGLLQYEEDAAGGLMNPRFAAIRADMGADEALTWLRRRAHDGHPSLPYAYVVDPDRHLLGVASLRELLAAPPRARVGEVMTSQPIAVPRDMDQEEVARRFARHGLLALPVIDAEGRIQGIVTADDIVDVVQEEATEDLHKFGGLEALEAPYLGARLGDMVRKRGGWLALLFVGEMLTASAMALFEEQIARWVVLALFVPLIISSGGNSGSQASTLVIRAMALGEVGLGDWWRVMRRELSAGLLLGAGLGLIGFVRIVSWEMLFGSYGPAAWRLGAAIACSLLGVVLFGTLAGSMLPFVLRRVGLDPASASAPFVATLVDVTGLVIYLSAATLFLS